MPTAAETKPTDRRLVISVLGFAQILGWGTSFYFPGVFAKPIIAETGWPLTYVVGGISIALLVSGLISPQIGKWIANYGSRPVLLASPVLFAAGLACIGLSSSLPVYLVSWILVGLGMGSGMYDAAFAALGRMYGQAARGPITNLTLFGGFASTICWPLSAMMIDAVGWREACLIYATLHLLVSLPIQALILRHEPVSHSASAPGSGRPRGAEPSRPSNQTAVFLLLALTMSFAAGVGAILIINLIIFLQARGIDFATAVAIGAVFGPSQVAARVVERLFGNNYHPIWTLVVACLLMAISLVMLYGGVPALIVIIAIFGAGFGISWVARGTVPLAMFGAARYPQMIGRLALPSLIVQAIAPTVGAWLIERVGADSTIGLLTVFALINVVLVGMLWAVSRHSLQADH
ncbi:MAG: MFS transporter [Xanthobacteraceae bacterium]|uniref:MFS transporter n=1 Tax=Pseudolabrys sp. TaxID=1960880 RepID=UPI003D148A0A